VVNSLVRGEIIIKAEQIKSLFNLKPHLMRGGFFVEMYRCDEYISEDLLPERYDGDRSPGMAIHYLLMPGIFSPGSALEETSPIWV
jgi:predicted cupin superfamily sugar epimerase